MFSGIIVYRDHANSGTPLCVDDQPIPPNEVVGVGNDYRLLYRRFGPDGPDSHGNFASLQLQDADGFVLDEYNLRDEHTKSTHYLVAFQPRNTVRDRREGYITPFNPAPVRIPAPSS